LPDMWVIGILDAANIIAARRPNAENVVGKPAPLAATSVITPDQSGWGLGSSLDGRDIYVFYNRLNLAPWNVLVGVPISEVDGAVWKAVAPVVSFGLLVLIVTIFVAWLFGRSFTNQLVSIAGAAMAFRSGSDTLEKVAPTKIRELAELKSTLDTAISQRTRYEAQLKSLIAEKDLLMQEVHHRVRNSLQLVRGILSLQARGSNHPEAKSALNAAAVRILTVADVHQHLYQGHSTAEVQVMRYLEDLATDLNTSMLDGRLDRKVLVEAPNVVWPSEKVIALGLIVTELTTNAIKYGSGIVKICLAIAPDQSAILIVEDEGPGFPADFDLSQSKGLGSRLISSLVREDEGSIEIDRAQPRGRVIVSLGPNWRNVDQP
jgi:two-component sensor histidine kinase